MANKSRWVTDVKKWDNLTKDTAALILDQSESLLADTVDTAKSISSKAEKLISILIPITSALVVYLVNSLKTEGFTVLNSSALLIIITLGFSTRFAYKNFTHYDIAVPGEYPNNILTSEYIDTPFINDGQYLNMVYNVCENIQARIEVNEILNKERSENNRRSIFLLALVPFLPIVPYLFFLVRGSCF